MKNLNRLSASIPAKRPIKVLQFGGGNFLRGFADWMIDVMNEKTNFSGDIQIIQSITNRQANPLHTQDGLYHVALKGKYYGELVSDFRLISSVAGVLNPNESPDEFLNICTQRSVEFIISNTTEAGIQFKEEPLSAVPETFPGKLTVLLLERFKASLPGVVLLPCELLENNGDLLRETILRYCDHWKLPNLFREWVIRENTFCNTLVDRIVPGFSDDLKRDVADKTGYADAVAVMAEPFYFWGIEGPSWLSDKFPATQCGLQVSFVKDIKPYHTRKVRILNGAHTTMMALGYLAGFRTVGECMEDKFFRNFVTAAIEEEIIPTLDLPREELHKFAREVIERFQNPFIEHLLLSISLNSIAKFKVRVLPTILEYNKLNNALPKRLLRAFAALIFFYRGEWNNSPIPVRDSETVVTFFSNAWKFNDYKEVVIKVLSNKALWGFDLTEISGLCEQLTAVGMSMIAEPDRLVTADHVLSEE